MNSVRSDVPDERSGGEGLQELGTEQLISFELTAREVDGAKLDVTIQIADMVASAIAEQTEGTGRSFFRPPLTIPTSTDETAADLQSRLIPDVDSELKAADLAKKYAEAALAKGRLGKIKFDLAWKGINNTIALCRSMGVPVEMFTFADGQPGILIGNSVRLRLPVTHSEIESYLSGTDVPTALSEE
jgi:hypothetical protein